jgi:hypothetical protein
MSLSDQWAEYAADHVGADVPDEQMRKLKRAWYAGAQSAALDVKRGAKPAEVLQEVRFFGQQIGTAHEART